MFRGNRTVLSVLVVAALAAFAVPTLAQAPYSEAVPTKKDPLRFSAFAVQMQGGMAGSVEVTIERWSTDAERNALVAQVQKTSDKEVDQRKLVTALQKIKERCGYLNLPNTMGWDIKYAHEATLPDGTRQLVIVTDKPVSFGMASVGQRGRGAVHADRDAVSEGQQQGRGQAARRDLHLDQERQAQLEIYGNEPTRLTQITEKNPKVKK